MDCEKLLAKLYDPVVLTVLPGIAESAIKSWIRTAYQHAFTAGQLDMIDKISKQTALISFKSK